MNYNPKVFGIFVLILSCAIATACLTAQPQCGVTLPGKVIRVIDGDTYVVEFRIAVNIRADECYAPELGTRPGDKAAMEMREHAEGKDCFVWLKIPDTGKLVEALTLGRWVGKVWLTDTPRDSLSEWAVKRGLASSTHNGKLGE